MGTTSLDFCGRLCIIARDRMILCLLTIEKQLCCDRIEISLGATQCPLTITHIDFWHGGSLLASKVLLRTINSYETFQIQKTFKNIYFKNLHNFPCHPALLFYLIWLHLCSTWPFLCDYVIREVELMQDEHLLINVYDFYFYLFLFKMTNCFTT